MSAADTGGARLARALGNEHYRGHAFGWIFLLGIGAVIILWWWRPLPLEAPGKYGALYLVPVVLLAFWAATRRRTAESAALRQRRDSPARA